MIEPLTAIKATTIFEKGGWEVSGVILARGEERCLVEAGAVRWMTAPALAAVMHPARAGALGTISEANARAGALAVSPGGSTSREEEPEDPEAAAWLAECAALCRCEDGICSSVRDGGICDSALD